MAKKEKGHRRSMFGDLTGGKRYQGFISKTATRAFERRRAELADLAKRKIGWTGAVSDAAVIEYLSRGEPWAVMFFEANDK